MQHRSSMGIRQQHTLEVWLEQFGLVCIVAGFMVDLEQRWITTAKTATKFTLPIP
jgi:hypothetical protein